jgi:hypothetical protein
VDGSRLSSDELIEFGLSLSGLMLNTQLYFSFNEESKMYANAISLTVADSTAWECIEHAAWAAWTTRDVSANATLPRKSWPSCVLRLPSENNDVTRPTSFECGVESIQSL